jgi:small subunit ribosomal protein S5
MAKIDPNTLDLVEQVVKTNKCQKTHKGGRTMSWNALVVVGDKHGHVGAAMGKARGIPDAIRKGTEAAKKAIINVPLDGTTIPHPVLVSFGASKVMLKPAAPGTGVVAGGSVRAILESAGVRDVLAKSLGSSNAINCAWATIKALQSLQTPEDVAARRGVEMKMLSVQRQALPHGIESNGATNTATIEGPVPKTADPAKRIIEKPGTPPHNSGPAPVVTPVTAAAEVPPVPSVESAPVAAAAEVPPVPSVESAPVETAEANVGDGNGEG